MDFTYENNRIFFMDNNKVLAEITFPDIDYKTVNMNHTFVDETLRGQGVANKLMAAAIEQIQRQQKKAVLTCSYAIQWFAKHPEYHYLVQTQMDS